MRVYSLSREGISISGLQRSSVIVPGVSTVDDVLEAEAATSLARGLGVRVGMSGREALKILS